MNGSYNVRCTAQRLDDLYGGRAAKGRLLPATPLDEYLEEHDELLEVLRDGEETER